MTTLRASPKAIGTDHVEFYRGHGYAILRGAFGADEVAALAAGFDVMKAKGMRHPATFRHGNVSYVIEHDPKIGRILRFMQWPAYGNALFARYRTDPRLLAIVEPLIGNDLKQIINQLIWKEADSARTTYAYHQDCRFRRPRSAYRDLGGSYIQTAIAIDPHRPENGCMRIYPGSHRLGDLGLGLSRGIMEAEYDERSLLAAGLDPAELVDLVLEPGDVALWGPFTVHGSGPNRSAIDRRAYVNGFVTARNCDRGEWAFRGGVPCALSEPVLVQYDDLYTRPEPHYVDGALSAVERK